MNVLCLQISINYTGKLKENGVVVESNAGEAPFKFRLGNISPFTRTFYYLDMTIVYMDLTLTLPFAGKGEVIEGWDIGLEGNHLNIFLVIFSNCGFFFILKLKYNFLFMVLRHASWRKEKTCCSTINDVCGVRLK